MVGQTAGLGLALSLVVALLFRWVDGPVAMAAAGFFGVAATVLQVVAVRLAAPMVSSGDYRGLFRRWVVGAGIRLAGVAAIPLAVTMDRERFPPLAAALGYIAVLIPLFFFEIRRFR